MKKIPAVLFRLLHRWAAPSKIGADYTMPAPLQLPPSPPAADGLAADIPKTIWTYWNHPEPDAFVLSCIQSWRVNCPGYAVHLVHPGNRGQHVPEEALPENFARLSPTKQADWIRLYLVARHGGFWLDASILLTRSLDWMLPARGPAEFVGFYLEGFTQDPEYPVIENWLFGAPAGSSFVTAWQQEFHQALVIEGTQKYLERAQADPSWKATRQGIPDPDYLLCHIAAQQVLRRQTHGQLVLYKAEDTAFIYHRALRWKWYLLYPQLCLVPAAASVAPLVKLRGGERRHFAEMQALHGGAVPGSLWDQALQLRPAAS